MACTIATPHKLSLHSWSRSLLNYGIERERRARVYYNSHYMDILRYYESASCYAYTLLYNLYTMVCTANTPNVVMFGYGWWSAYDDNNENTSTAYNNATTVHDTIYTHTRIIYATIWQIGIYVVYTRSIYSGYTQPITVFACVCMCLRCIRQNDSRRGNCIT